MIFILLCGLFVFKQEIYWYILLKSPPNDKGTNAAIASTYIIAIKIIHPSAAPGMIKSKVCRKSDVFVAVLNEKPILRNIAKYITFDLRAI